MIDEEVLITKAVDWMVAHNHARPHWFKTGSVCDGKKIILGFIERYPLVRTIIIAPLANFSDWRKVCAETKTGALFVTADQPPNVAGMTRMLLVVSTSSIFRRLEELMIYAPEIVITDSAETVAVYGEEARRTKAIENLERQSQIAWRFSALYPNTFDPFWEKEKSQDA